MTDVPNDQEREEAATEAAQHVVDEVKQDEDRGTPQVEAARATDDEQP